MLSANISYGMSYHCMKLFRMRFWEDSSQLPERLSEAFAVHYCFAAKSFVVLLFSVKVQRGGNYPVSEFRQNRNRKKAYVMVVVDQEAALKQFGNSFVIALQHCDLRMRQVEFSFWSSEPSGSIFAKKLVRYELRC
jgi:hypothetical protein